MRYAIHRPFGEIAGSYSHAGVWINGTHSPAPSIETNAIAGPVLTETVHPLRAKQRVALGNREAGFNLGVGRLSRFELRRIGV